MKPFLRSKDLHVHVPGGLLLLLATACSGGSSPTSSDPTSDPTPDVTPAAITVTRGSEGRFEVWGDTVRAVAQVTNASGAPLSETVSWSSSDPSVITIDARGLMTVAGGGEATITATTGNLAADMKVVVPMPLFTTAFVDTATVMDFLVFGEDLGGKLNPAYELYTDGYGMPVVAAAAGRIDYLQYQADTDDYEIFVRTSDGWGHSYDHVAAVAVTVGETIVAGDTLGTVPFFGNYQVGTDLHPMGRVELQVYYGANNTPLTPMCPARFGTEPWNATFEAMAAKVRTDGAPPCLADQLPPE